MRDPQYPSRAVLIRDLLILQMKLMIDAIKDVLLMKLALLAVIFDLLFGRAGRPRLFYAVLRLGERFDLWMNLYSAARGAEGSDQGLFGTSRAGANTLLGRLEQIVLGRSEEATSTHGG